MLGLAGARKASPRMGASVLANIGLVAAIRIHRLALRCGRQPGFATIADIGWLTRDSGFLLIVILQSRI